jgi:predicted kinase
MATLHLMVGLPCSGKTTLARQLEQHFSALRLTPDEWHTRLFGQDATEPDHDTRHELVEALLWEVAERVLTLGLDVILDTGFWVRSQRDELRTRAAKLGVDFKVHYIEVSNEELLARLSERNARLPVGAFYIPESMLKEWFLIFEPPAQAELEYTIVY